MLNFLVHQILSETWLNMDENKKRNCRAVSWDCFKAVLRVGEVKRLSSYLCKKQTFHCNCAIRHVGGLGCSLGESQKTSSTLRATSTELPWSRTFRWQGDSSAPVQGLETAALTSSLTTSVLKGDGTRSSLLWSGTNWVLRAFKVSRRGLYEARSTFYAIWRQCALRTMKAVRRAPNYDSRKTTEHIPPI